jgi:hypothetical protein
MRNSARIWASEARPAQLLPRRRHMRGLAKRIAKLLRFCARKGVTSWNWPCGHQPRPPESKGSRGASNAPRQQTQRRTGFLRGQSFVRGVALRSERYGSRPCEDKRELRPDGEVGVKLDTLKATDAEWQPAPLVLGQGGRRLLAGRRERDSAPGTRRPAGGRAARLGRRSPSRVPDRGAHVRDRQDHMTR